MKQPATWELTVSHAEFMTRIRALVRIPDSEIAARRMALGAVQTNAGKRIVSTSVIQRPHMKEEDHDAYPM